MAGRDRVVLWVLGGGMVVAVLTWNLVGEWPALIVLVLAVVAAAVAYRIEPPRIDLDGRPWLAEEADADRDEAQGDRDDARIEPIDQ